MERYQRYFLYRNILFLSLLGTTFFFLRGTGHLIPLVLFSVIFVIDDSLVFLKKRVELYNLMLDVTYLSFFVLYTGGVYSPFTPFYFTLILFVPYLLSSLDSFIIAGYSVLLYGLICFGILGPLREWFDVLHISNVTDLPEVLLKFIIYSLSFLFTAALSSIIIERMKEEVKKIRVSAGDMLEAIDYGIIAVDSRRRIIWSNSIAEYLLDSRIKHMDNLDNIITEEFFEKMKGIFTDSRREIEFEYGDKFFRIRRYELNGEEGILFLIQDMTEEKKKEEKMKLREKLVTLGQFAANLAHGVRNPISSIRASAELFDCHGKSGDKNRQLKNFIMEESDHLNEMVKNFLDFTRDFSIEKDKVNVSKVFEEVKKILERNKYYKDNVEIEYRVRRDVKIYADYSLLKSLLVNLGTNSLKAMRDGGRLIFKLEENNGNRIIEVVDNGSGIDEEHLNEIFSPFFSRFNDGFGLGLNTVKKVAELHDWRVEVESDSGKGTKFRVIL